ncbi:MAG: hypothetical protein R3349_12360 [Geminicoccaceae bacterium]|nr:hypothetical protein [Geminicoccaceae bacterium]
MHPTPKTGLRSSEFWMSLVAALTMVANEGFGLDLPTESVMSLAAVTISYIFGRTVVKTRGQA